MHQDAELNAVMRGLLHASHLLEPDELTEEVQRAAQRLGAGTVAIYLADYEQHELRLLVHPDRQAGPVLPIDSTAGGRVFRTEQPAEVTEGEGRRLLLPLIDGTHRLGVLEVLLPAGQQDPMERWLPFADLVADLIVAKAPYGDTITIARRRQPMALRAEAQRALLPPLTLISPRFLVTGMLVPSYEVAGDLFDYAVNGDTLHIAILDAMGHSLSATLTAAVAIAGYRNSRRGGASLVERWKTADTAVAREFGGERFATAVFAELDLATGRLRSVSAGHPPALVARENRVIARCADEPTLPLGLGGEEPSVTEEHLQPGDRLLLFTDGIVEARSGDGEFFGEDRLVEQIARELGTGLPAPEAVRRLVRTIADHQDGRLRDDATLMLVEWRGADQDEPHPAAT